MQQFRIVKCSECDLYQVDIVKKAKKWSCKVCSRRQSLKNVYFTSFAGMESTYFLIFVLINEMIHILAKECREKSQELNLNKHKAESSRINAELDQLEGSEEEVDSILPANPTAEVEKPSVDQTTTKADKWLKFVTKPDEDKTTHSERLKRNLQAPDQDSYVSPTCNKFHSIYQQPKSAALPSLIDLHKKPSTSKINFPSQISHEPPQKKLKEIEDDDDDFIFTQEVLDSLR